MRRIARLLFDDRGQDMVEYALLAGFVAVVAGVILPSIALRIESVFSEMTSLTCYAAGR